MNEKPPEGFLDEGEALQADLDNMEPLPLEVRREHRRQAEQLMPDATRLDAAYGKDTRPDDPTLAGG